MKGASIKLKRKLYKAPYNTNKQIHQNHARRMEG